jgi:hypothetical protein
LLICSKPYKMVIWLVRVLFNWWLN